MKILATSRNPRHGFSKHPESSITLVTGEGIEGDAHRGLTTQHLYLKRKNPNQPNLAQVHLLAQEKLDDLASKGFPLIPGELGENILTEGLDLLALPTGTLLHLGPEAIVEVTGLRTPCSQIDTHRPGLQQHCWGDRNQDKQRTREVGIMSIVHTGGRVHPNDLIHIELPPQPHKPLGPV